MIYPFLLIFSKLLLCIIWGCIICIYTHHYLTLFISIPVMPFSKSFSIYITLNKFNSIGNQQCQFLRIQMCMPNWLSILPIISKPNQFPLIHLSLSFQNCVAVFFFSVLSSLSSYIFEKNLYHLKNVCRISGGRIIIYSFFNMLLVLVQAAITKSHRLDGF